MAGRWVFLEERSAEFPIEGSMAHANNWRDDTRERLIATATRLFAERGFYGTSIAQVSGELGLTKQALLYYFNRKDDLYTEVFRRISERLLAALYSSVDEQHSPEDQLEGMVMGLYHEAQARPLDTRVLVRELLDNQSNQTPPEQRYLKTFLDAMVAQISKVERFAQMPKARRFAIVYQLISVIEYFTFSRTTLKCMYGEDEFEAIAEAFPGELRAQVQRLLAAA